MIRSVEIPLAGQDDIPFYNKYKVKMIKADIILPEKSLPISPKSYSTHKFKLVKMGYFVRPSLTTMKYSLHRPAKCLIHVSTTYWATQAAIL